MLAMPATIVFTAGNTLNDVIKINLKISQNNSLLERLQWFRGMLTTSTGSESIQPYSLQMCNAVEHWEKSFFQRELSEIPGYNGKK